MRFDWSTSVTSFSENNFIKEIKHVLCAFVASENLGKVCENSRANENPRLGAVEGFYLSAL